MRPVPVSPVSLAANIRYTDHFFLVERGTQRYVNELPQTSGSLSALPVAPIDEFAPS